MEMLQVKGEQIIDSKGKPVRLRGTNIGGWMNMENFISGFPGTETVLRDAIIKSLGKIKGEYFFERFLDCFFNENDLKFLKECGVNVIRLPLHYRHFEDDERPFVYKEAGFERLDRIIDWCEKYEIHVILDLHAAQGWQNSHWHGDNSRGVSLLWRNAHFQERFIKLWQEFAARYRDKAVIAGYDLINEPCVNTPYGDYPYNFFNNYQPDFERMNRLYREAVAAIRKIDAKHIIFLEGDKYAALFNGLEAPFAENLVYSSHNYTIAGFGPGPYPGTFTERVMDVDDQTEYWDRQKQVEAFQTAEGTQFAVKHQVPLLVGEFGAQYNGPAEEVPYRLAAMDEQIGVFEEFGAHWTTWTYKDVGVMGWVTLDPESEYMQLIKDVQEKKKLLGAENFVNRSFISPVKNKLNELALLIKEQVNGYHIDDFDNLHALTGIVLQGYAAGLLLPVYADLFKGMNEDRLDAVLSSFDLKNCRANQGLLKVIRKYAVR